MEKIEFETYGNKKIIQSATNIKTKIRIPQTPAKMLYNLSQNMDEFLDKPMQVEIIYGSCDYFKTRSYDVHLHKIKRMLKESPYKIATKQGKVGIFKLD